MRTMKCIQIFHKPIAILQVLLLLLIALAIPMASTAAENAIPQMPLILKGNATVNGQPAEIGTEVTAMIGDKVVGTTKISTAGVYGDLPTNRLLVTSEPENYDQIKIYIDGIETESINGSNIQNARPGNTINLDISVNNGQQVMSNPYILILLGGIVIVGAAVVAMKYKKNKII